MGNNTSDKIYYTDKPVVLFSDGKLNFVWKDKSALNLYKKGIMMLVSYDELSTLNHIINNQLFMRIFQKPYFTISVKYLEKKKADVICEDEILDETKSSSDINYVHKYKIIIEDRSKIYHKQFLHIASIKYSEFKKLLPELIEVIK